MEIIGEAFLRLILLLTSPFNHGMMQFTLRFIPFFLFLELPVYVLVLLGIIRYYVRKDTEIPEQKNYYPRVSCIITCYSEGRNVAITIRSIAEQMYPGLIEIIPVIDGASQNGETYRAAKELEAYVDGFANRILKVIPKWQRGGRVSSLNAGMNMATGEVVMALDGDTSFDNNMVRDACVHFSDADIIGVAGSLRVRNVYQNLVTRLQGLEYLLSIHASKVGLSEFNVVNNISGAFGIFRRQFLEKIGGWDAGTAEDLDITLRMKNYFGRHPNLKIIFEPKAIGHTDAPDTFGGLIGQRLRWDGDLYYLYIRKHPLSFSPRMFGWKNFIIQIWTGLFFQLIMPFIIILYTMYVFAVHSAGLVLAVWSMVYLVYLSITLLFFIVHILLLSERRKEDIKLAWVIPMMPIFAFALRIWNALATLKEMITKSHLDSTMAPWWVLKKTKF